jgi:hypothetical protein
MKYYIKQSGDYIELLDTTPVSNTFIEIPFKRPDDTYDWNGTDWVKSSRENELNKELRANAYKEESDPIFFQWQRGSKTQQDWLDKIAEINQRYPKY